MTKIALSIFFLNACSSLAVTSNFDRAYDFSHASTFSFAPNPRRDTPQPSSEPDSLIDNSIVRRHLRAALVDVLAKKGFVYQKEGGQLLVAYYVNAVSKERLIANHSNYGWDYGYGVDNGYGYGYGWPGAGWNYGYNFAPISPEPMLDVQRYEEGTVVIDIVDPATKHLVWRGRGIRDISVTADETALKIRKTSEKILGSFPPR